MILARLKSLSNMPDNINPSYTCILLVFQVPLYEAFNCKSLLWFQQHHRNWWNWDNAGMDFLNLIICSWLSHYSQLFLFIFSFFVFVKNCFLRISSQLMVEKILQATNGYDDMQEMERIVLGEEGYGGCSYLHPTLSPL